MPILTRSMARKDGGTSTSTSSEIGPPPSSSSSSSKTRRGRQLVKQKDTKAEREEDNESVKSSKDGQQKAKENKGRVTRKRKVEEVEEDVGFHFVPPPPPPPLGLNNIKQDSEPVGPRKVQKKAEVKKDKKKGNVSQEEEKSNNGTPEVVGRILRPRGQDKKVNTTFKPGELPGINPQVFAANCRVVGYHWTKTFQELKESDDKQMEDEKKFLKDLENRLKQVRINEKKEQVVNVELQEKRVERQQDKVELEQEKTELEQEKVELNYKTMELEQEKVELNHETMELEQEKVELNQETMELEKEKVERKQETIELQQEKVQLQQKEVEEQSKEDVPDPNVADDLFTSAIENCDFVANSDEEEEENDDCAPDTTYLTDVRLDVTYFKPKPTFGASRLPRVEEDEDPGFLPPYSVIPDKVSRKDKDAHSSASSSSSSSTSSFKSAVSVPGSTASSATCSKTKKAILPSLKTLDHFKKKAEEVQRNKEENLKKKQELQKKKNEEWKQRADKIRQEQEKEKEKTKNEKINILKKPLAPAPPAHHVYKTVSGKPPMVPKACGATMANTGGQRIVDGLPSFKPSGPMKVLSKQPLIAQPKVNLGAFSKFPKTPVKSLLPSSDDVFKTPMNMSASFLDKTIDSSGELNNYDITRYEDLDEDLKHRENKPIPKWAEDKFQVTCMLFKQLCVTEFQQPAYPFPRVEHGFKLYDSRYC